MSPTSSDDQAQGLDPYAFLAVLDSARKPDASTEAA